MPPMNLLALDPENTLFFCKNATTPLPTRMLKLTNSSQGYVAFKVKTTAPKAYLVRPSSGTLKPGDSQEVTIILQEKQAGGAEVSNPSDRFLVQAVGVTEVDPVTREDWAKFPKERLQEQKLNVVVEEREGGDDESVAKPGGAEARTGPASPDVGATELKVKYDELVQYTLTLEKEKKKLEADMNSALSTKPSADAGYTKVTLILAVLVAFLVPYAAKFLG